MSAVVLAARGWIGTPYLHQASVKGAGCDCLGLLRGVWREVFGAEPEAVPPYSMDWAEPQGIEVLLGAARRHLVEKPVADAAPGDVLVFRMRSGAVAKHVGLMGSESSFIHSFSGHGVVESALTDGWRRRIAGCFGFDERRD